MLKNTGYFRSIECPFSEACLRPHCFFRHTARGGGGISGRKARNGAEYDPFSPEIPVPPCMDEDILGVLPKSSQHILELERVNKAIEEVKSQVEREQRKYEELLETQNAPSKKCLRSNSLSSLEYDPGCSGSSASCYNPTPLAQPVNPCKYTLDTVEHDRTNRRILEYIPTTVTQVSRSKTNKYVIDNSKPYTDLEYDPMLNYSARLLSKDKPEKVTKRSKRISKDESYVPVFKKLCSQTSKIMVEAKPSGSECDSQSQCSPKTGKPLPSTTKSSSLNTSKSPVYETKKGSSMINDTAVQYDVDDIGNSLKSSCRKEHIKKITKPLNPKNEKMKCINETVPSGQVTCINKEQRKESSKAHIKKKSEQEVDISTMDNQLEEYKEKRNERSLEQTENKINLKSSKTGLQRQNKIDTEKSCKVKTSKNDHRSKDLKNGKQKAKHMKSASLDKSKTAVQKTLHGKTSQRNLSHVDLFGDETSDEEESRNSSRQSNSSSNKAEKSSHKSKVASIRTSITLMDSPEMDISLLEKDMDSDSDLDPMEECLRVFNESHDIKTEDKGRMGKQVTEKETVLQESSTTLIPGQKRRISHVTSPNSVNSPSKAAMRPYSRSTPQEICYQRIQKAQEQATQLLAQRNTDLLSSFVQKSSSMKSIGEKNAQLVGGVETSDSSSSAIKLRTLSGMASKTKSTTVEKRKAHAPSLQISKQRIHIRFFIIHLSHS